jgi:uncharacterized protein DUF6916
LHTLAISMSTPLENLTANVFREHLHTKFKVPGDTSGMVLELFDVVESNTSPKMELFSLYFRGPFSPRLGQQIHSLEHDSIGRVEIFLTPVEADQEKGTVYESVFHRFRK